MQLLSVCSPLLVRSNVNLDVEDNRTDALSILAQATDNVDLLLHGTVFSRTSKEDASAVATANTPLLTALTKTHSATSARNAVILQVFARKTIDNAVHPVLAQTHVLALATDAVTARQPQEDAQGTDDLARILRQLATHQHTLSLQLQDHTHRTRHRN